MATTDNGNREREIFEAALDIASAEGRLGYLKGACGQDAALLARVQALLRAHEAPESFLPEQPKAGATVSIVTEKAGDKIGHYKLLQQIGEGGCGVVYMAEQEEPIRRRVALKVIKLGMDTKAVIARFEAERQALALMDHPNIAKVLDAGATDTGRPYFVMELVRGIKITDYCDQNNLSTEQRLDLFVQICHAIQHAHQKGIIHRDIKPSNILVTVHDGKPLPKIIDFGIAKATSGQVLTDKTLFTAFEQFIGTPAYMSPEQAEMSTLDIDTRSDIYALGVLLYELLTGQTPFDAQELVAAGLNEMRRIIREQEPMRPSTRISTLEAADQTTMARRRHSDPPQLIHLVRGDLDWIVMKCLEKDRTRRYETANGLAADLTRFINNEPVEARPPGRLYRFQKLVRRNKLVFAATAAVTAALLMGLGISIGSLNKERKARLQAELAEKNAKSEAEKSQQVLRFLKGMLKGMAPEVARGRDTTLMREVLDDTAKRVQTELANQPEVRADLQQTMGNTYYALGQYPEAEQMLRETLDLRHHASGETNLTLAETMNDLGNLLHGRGRDREADDLLRQSISIQRSLSATNTALFVNTLVSLESVFTEEERGPEAEKIGREALAIARTLPDSESETLASALVSLADGLCNVRKLLEVEALSREGVGIYETHDGPSGLATLDAKRALAKILIYKGSSAEAEPIIREVLAEQRKIYPADHPTVALTLTDLGAALSALGRDAEAVPVFKEALAIRQKGQGYAAGESVVTAGNLAQALIKLKRTNEVDRLYRELVPPEAESDPKNYGLLLFRAQYYAQSRRFLDGAREVTLAMKIDPDDDYTRIRLATLLVAGGDQDGYETARQSMLAHFRIPRDQGQAMNLVIACLLTPANGDMLRQATALANGLNGTVSPSARAKFVKSLVEFRNEQFTDAVESGQDALKDGNLKPGEKVAAMSVLAMAQSKAGEPLPARATFDQARQIANKEMNPLNPLAVFREDWDVVIAAEIFLREAECLINDLPSTSNHVTPKHP